MKTAVCCAIAGAMLLSSLPTALAARAAQPTTRSGENLAARKPGEAIRLGGRSVTVKQMHALPVVRDKWTERFVFDRFGNPKLAKLRSQEKLDEVVAPGKDEFHRQVLLLDWAYRRVKRFGAPTSKARGALEVLKAVDEGHTFYCAHYAQILMGAAASLGWIDRGVALRLGNDTPGSTEHSITEIWSNQHGKWVMFDPTYALYCTAGGVPLNAWEIRQEWLYRDGNDLIFVIGAEPKEYRKADMPIFRARHRGYGDLSLKPRAMDKYAFLGYVPNTNWMDAPPDYKRMFITKDSLCEGIKWHTRDNPTDPAREPYFPINQAALTLTPAEGAAVSVKADTFTPNFSHYEHRLDGGKWVKGVPGAWTLHEGANSLEVASVNLFGVRGHPSKVVLEMK
ncbi:MAG TPA: hypothetical protein VNA25_14325 [Phycisphaerae bacterium]|nr:hypothetical protein [Phycisphaerae bacterium]